MNNFSERLLQNVDLYPQKQILHFLKTGHEDQHVTYQELLNGAKQYAQLLIDHGIEPEEVVILILPQSIDLVFAYFGVILNGSIPSIMPFLTEKLLPEKYRSDLISLINITKPSAILTYKDFSAELQSIQKENSFIKALLYSTDVKSTNIKKEAEFKGLYRKANDIVLLQHSSGTTGLQKGVALSHQAIFNQLDSYAQALHIDQDDVIVSWLPLYHDMGLIACFLMPILYNVTLVLMSPFEWVRAPHKLFNAVSKYRGTLCWLPNFAYNFCAKKIRPADMEGINLSSLRAVINCSEPMRYESHEMFLNRFKENGLRSYAIATCYAMAENVFAVTQDGIDKTVTYDEIDLEIFQKYNKAIGAIKGQKSIIMVSAGNPVENTQVKIINQDGKECPERQLGEIVIQSNCMLSEYYHRPNVNENTLIDGWFKTGDLGYIASGELYISGRKKDLIIVGGKNVYPQDIETVVSEVEGIHSGRSVAFGIFNEAKGTEDVIVIAELEKGYEEQAKEIADKIRRNVNQSTAVALRNVYLVNGFWLIKTSSGKIARAANKEKYLLEINKIQ